MPLMNRRTIIALCRSGSNGPHSTVRPSPSASAGDSEPVRTHPMKRISLLAVTLSLSTFLSAAEEVLPRLAHSNPGALADLGVGLWAWPLPIDYNKDGLMDLV